MFACHLARHFTATDRPAHQLLDVHERQPETWRSQMRAARCPTGSTCRAIPRRRTRTATPQAAASAADGDRGRDVARHRLSPVNIRRRIIACVLVRVDEPVPRVRLEQNSVGSNLARACARIASLSGPVLDAFPLYRVGAGRVWRPRPGRLGDRPRDGATHPPTQTGIVLTAPMTPANRLALLGPCEIPGVDADRAEHLAGSHTRVVRLPASQGKEGDVPRSLSRARPSRERVGAPQRVRTPRSPSSVFRLEPSRTRGWH